VTEREMGERDPDDADDADDTAEIVAELSDHGDMPEADVIEQHQSVPEDDEYDDEHDDEYDDG
jgi:hypothetical protein